MKQSFSRSVVIALALAVLTILLLTLTAPDIGLTWDEPGYMVASESYVMWLGELITQPGFALSDQAITQSWGPNHEHPPFDKFWSGLIWAGARYDLDDLTAHRLGNILLAGLLVALLYLLVLDFGQVAGLASVAALLTMPRFFFHAHLAALDVPTSVTMFLVVFVFWRTIDRPGPVWGLVLGMVYGLALATKINGLIELPIVLILFALLFGRRKYVFARLVTMALTGLLVVVILWPWLYRETWSRLFDYLEFMTVGHYKILQWYRGQLYLPPPWHFPFAMILAVLPLTLTILCAVGGLYLIVRGRIPALGGLLFLGAAIPVLVVASGKGQVFDDERLLMPSFPYLAAIAGIGFSWLTQLIRAAVARSGHPLWTRPLWVLLVAVAFVPQTVLAFTYYPHLLSYYSETMGGLPGATRLGFESTYWADSYVETLAYLNAHAPEGAMVWAEAHDVMLYYQLHGKLRSDLKVASPTANDALVKGVPAYKASIKETDYAVVQFRQSGFYGDLVPWIRSRKPVYEYDYAGIPIVAIYVQ